MAEKAEIIAIGDELLGGHTIDTNSTWISSAIKHCGLSTFRKHIIADSPEEIRHCLKRISPHTKYIFLTGGLGPTKDDLTKKVLADYFHSTLTLNETVYISLVERYKHLGRKFTEANKEQAFFPDKAKVIPNNAGTAPGMEFVEKGQHFFVMPGVPSEMKTIMSEFIIPQICEENEANYKEINLRTSGMPESDLASIVEPVFENYPDVKLGFYPSYHGVDIRFGMDVNQDLKILETITSLLYAKLGNLIYTEGKKDMTEIVARQLTEKGWTLALAESCTGGLVSHRITQNPGSSRYFTEGIVVYSNEAKMKYLNVKEDTLIKYGAVSQETVSEMLQGILKKSGADIVGAISGIAGPDGGSEEKPVGTIYYGVASRTGSIVKHRQFSKERIKNKHFSSQALLNLIRLELLK